MKPVLGFQPLQPSCSAPCASPSAAAEPPPALRGPRRPPPLGAGSAKTQKHESAWNDCECVWQLLRPNKKSEPWFSFNRACVCLERKVLCHLQDHKRVVFAEGRRAGRGFPPLLPECWRLLVSPHPFQLLLDTHPRPAHLSLPEPGLVHSAPGTILRRTRYSDNLKFLHSVKSADEYFMYFYGGSERFMDTVRGFFIWPVSQLIQASHDSKCKPIGRFTL